MHQNQPSGRQFAAARVLLGLSSRDLAGKAGLSAEIVARAEAAEFVPADLAEAFDVIQATLEAAGAIFLFEDGEGPGVRLRKSHAPDEGLKPEDLNSANDG